MAAADIILEEVDTPLGVVVFGATEKGLCLLDFKHRKSFPAIMKRIHTLYGERSTVGTSAFIDQTKNELDQYFTGDLQEFTVPLDMRGSPFQLKVWNSLLQIPYGKTVSYMDIAKQIGQPKAVRAVANANGQNGIAIVIPCHRVIGTDGTLTGYGGGLANKKKLLQLESAKEQKKMTDFLP